MRILHINASYKPAYIYGGPTMSVSQLCEQLIQAGCLIEVFTTTANGTTELEVQTNTPVNIDGVKVTYFKRVTKDHTHLSPALLKAVWKNVKRFDAVHIHAWWNLTSILACFIATAKKIPVVLSPRGTLSPYSFTNKNTGVKSLLHQLLGLRLLKLCHIHATSARESAAILKIINPLSITTIPNFVKLADGVADHDLATSTIQLLFFSRIEEKKGLDLLLDALKLLQIPYHLTIAGDGNKEYVDQLKSIAMEHGVAEHITWAGFQTDNKFDVLNRHHLLVLPSHDENFGNVVIESLSAGTAVLISAQVGLAAYVKENQLGWVCETNSVSISNTITAIVKQHYSQLKHIRDKAPQFIKNDFSGDKIVNQYINLYQKLTLHDGL